MSIEQKFSKEQILSMLPEAVAKGDTAQIRLLIAKNQELGLDGLPTYDLILATDCPYKARAYKTVGEIVGSMTLKKLTCGKNTMNGWESLPEFILANDCRTFKADFTKSAGIKRVEYNGSILKITPIPLSFFCSDSINTSKWDLSVMVLLMQRLDSCLNVPIDEWYAKETKKDNYLPF
jgi:hypothetical protein